MPTSHVYVYKGKYVGVWNVIKVDTYGNYVNQFIIAHLQWHASLRMWRQSQWSKQEYLLCKERCWSAAGNVHYI